MSSEDDKFWETVANQLRKKKGYRPLTDEEAEKALDETPNEVPPSLEEALRIVEQLIRDEEPKPQPRAELAKPANEGHTSRHSADQLRPQYPSICRRPGQTNDDAMAKEDRHIQDMLDED
jgi:hypothetical protein